MGDSYITGSFSPALQPALVALDPSLSRTPNTGVAGVSMATGGLSTIQNVPRQLDTVIGRYPKVKFLIFDGGGNDGILCDTAQFPRCDTVCLQAGSTNQQVCKDIAAKADAAFKGMLTTAAQAGVKDAIYFYYPHTPMKNGGANEFLDYAVNFAKATCDGANAATGGKLNCWFVPLVEPFKAAFGDAARSQFETVMSVHPLAPGVNLMAKEIFGAMKAHCVGFTAQDATKYGCTCKQ
jgi:hypothetical protein